MTRATFVGKARHVRKRVFRPDLALLATAVLGGALVGRSLANGQIMFAGLVAGFVLVVALGQAGWLPYVACVAIVGTFAFQSSLPQLAIPGNPFVSDLVLVGAFAAWLLMRGRTRDVSAPGDFPVAPQVAVALLLLGGLAGMFVGVSNGVDLNDAMRDARDIVFYATFWLALTAFSDRDSRFLVFKIGAWAAVAIVLAQIVQGVLGPSTLLFVADNPLQELITCASRVCADPAAEGFPRVRPPGLVLVYATACFAAAYLLWGPRRRRVAVGLLLAVCGTGVLVSQNRNMLIGLVAGLGLVGLLAKRRGRLAAVMAVGIVIVSVFAGATGRSSVGDSTVLERVTSLTSLSDLEASSTVRDRLRENSIALDTLAESPIVGVGWGVPFGLSLTVFRDGEFTTVQPLFIHQQYLHIWLRAGVLGLVGLLAALVLSVVFGVRWLRRGDEESAWLGAGVIAAVTAIAVSSLVGIYIVNPASAPVLAGLFALATVLQRELASSS